MKNQCEGLTYYDNYKIMDNGTHLGYIEDHCRHVLERYFIAWRKKRENINEWETKMFDTWDECIEWIKEK